MAAERSAPGPRPAGDGRGDAGGRPSFEAEALPELEHVYRFALRLTGDPAEADDLTQETFLRAWRARDGYAPGTRIRSWLFTICRNVFLRRRERSARHREVVTREAPRGDGRGGRADLVNPVWSAADASDPEDDFFRFLVDDRVVEALDGLPEEFRTAIVLSDVEGLPYTEIAELMEVPVGTVKSRIFRGRRLLQKVLHDYAVEVGVVTPETPGDRPRTSRGDAT